MKPMNIVNRPFFALSFFSLCAWADVGVKIPETVNLFASPNGAWVGSTGNEPAVATFSNFSESALGKYFTIAIGPEFTNILSGRSASFTGIIFDDRCRVVDSPLPVALQDFNTRKSEYQTQAQQLSTCLQMRVRDAAGIRPAENQPHCKVLTINPNEALVSGGLCFFQVRQESGFTVSYEVNPDCGDDTKFASLNLEPLDIFANSSFFISGDATGQSTYLSSLGWTSLRFSIEAPEASVPLSTNMGQGTPRWPVRAQTDFHLGQFSLEEDQNSARIVTQLFAANECRNDESLECRFALPLGMRFSLREINSEGKSELLDQWYAGGVAPARWKGFVPAERRLSYRGFKAGQRYRLEADLTYMSLYYQLFRDGFRDFLVSLGILTIDPSQPLQPLAPVAIIPSLQSLRPQTPLPTVHPLSPGGGYDLALELNRMRALLTGIDWPPFLERMCGPSGCVRALEGQAKVVVGVDFTIDEFVQGRAKMSQYQVWRESSYLPEYKQSVQSLMRADCR